MKAGVIDVYRRVGASVRITMRTKMTNHGTILMEGRSYGFTERTYPRGEEVISLFCADVDNRTQTLLGIQRERYSLSQVRKHFKIL